MQNYFQSCAVLLVLGHKSKSKNEKHQNLRNMSLADAVASLTICSIGITLNFCEAASLVHAKRTKLPFDITLISLAISDFLLALFVATTIVVIYIQPIVVTSPLYGKIFVFFFFLLSSSSALHMFFIAIQRLIAVLYPLKVSIWITKKRSVITLLLLWVISIAASTPITNYTYQRIVICTPFISAVVVVACYFIMSFKMVKRRAPVVARQQKQNISVLVYSISITAIFIICTLPFAIVAIQEPVPLLSMSLPSYVIHLFYLQVVLDPILYFFCQISKRVRCTMCRRFCQCFVSANVSTNIKLRSAIKDK